jgi:hypothetical protein
MTNKIRSSVAHTVKEEAVSSLAKKVRFCGMQITSLTVLSAFLLLVFVSGLVFVFFIARPNAFPPLTETLYLGTVELAAGDKGEEADFLLFNHPKKEFFSIVPLGEEDINYPVQKRVKKERVLQTSLQFKSGKVIKGLVFSGSKESIKGEVLQGEVSTEDGPSGIWKLYPVQTLAANEKENAETIAQLREVLDEQEREIISWRQKKQELENAVKAVEGEREPHKYSVPVEQDTVSEEEAKGILATLERQESSLLNDLVRKYKYSDKGRAIELANESLERELRWFEAHLATPKKPSFIDSDDEYYFQRSQRARELEAMIEQEEQKIATFYEEQEREGVR